MAGCRSPAAGSPGLDDAGRRLIYERADRVFETGVLFKPSAASEELPGFALAPLLMLEGGSGTPPPVVHMLAGSARIDGRLYEQRTFLWGAQGVRVTLGSDGFPALYEVLNDSSGARLIFVTETLEAAAAGEYGDPLEGRRFAIERAVGETPAVVVAGTMQPGPVPLGPFVYLTREARDVASVICRCMESRVETVTASLEYELVPIEEPGRSGITLPRWLQETASPAGLLRWPEAAL